jgi:hypothetical protein
MDVEAEPEASVSTDYMGGGEPMSKMSEKKIIRVSELI